MLLILRYWTWMILWRYIFCQMETRCSGHSGIVLFLLCIIIHFLIRIKQGFFYIHMDWQADHYPHIDGRLCYPFDLQDLLHERLQTGFVDDPSPDSEYHSMCRGLIPHVVTDDARNLQDCQSEPTYGYVYVHRWYTSRKCIQKLEYVLLLYVQQNGQHWE